MYLAGTIHKLPPGQYPLPEEYGAAYDRAGTIVFETDLGAMQSLEAQARILARGSLPDGETLSGVLDPATYEALKTYCGDIGFPIDVLEPLRPVMAMLTLLTVTMQSLGVTAPGVDEHFYRRARADSKIVLALESVDDQINQLMALDQGQPDAFVRRSIEDLREARRGGLEKGMRIWRRGDERALVRHFIDDPMQYSPAVYQSLLVDRNRQWMTSIRGYLATPESELVLVGVAHLVGDHGLVTMLRAEGYRVERYRGR
jgi:uncharacterized protein YbaP (TraB family)